MLNTESVPSNFSQKSFKRKVPRGHICQKRFIYRQACLTFRLRGVASRGAAGPRGPRNESIGKVGRNAVKLIMY